MFDTMHVDEVRTFYTFDKKMSIYIDCRKLNAEFNKVIKAVGHRARFFEKKMRLNTSTLPTISTLFGYFHILTYQVFKLSQNIKSARYVHVVLQ